jgi:hypothetical protein
MYSTSAQRCPKVGERSVALNMSTCTQQTPHHDDDVDDCTVLLHNCTQLQMRWGRGTGELRYELCQHLYTGGW